MKIAVFSAKAYEREFLEAAATNTGARLELVYFEAAFNARTAALAGDAGAVCLFVNDKADRAALSALAGAARTPRILALRSAGFNHVDLQAAEELGMCVARVPAYSPYAVAEHAAALLMALNRRLHRAFNRTREHNFSLEGLMGFDLHGKTVGVVGTGKIGECFARIMLGFGCRVLAADPVVNPVCTELGVEYTSTGELFAQSDVISLHCPLNPATRHLIDDRAVERMKPGVVIVNTSRGAVVDTRAVIDGLKSRKIGGLALDVYEEEGDVFFKDLSDQVLDDDVLARLLTFPNVVLTAHQAFFTHEAMTGIAETTVGNVAAFAKGGADAVPAANRVLREKLVR